MRKEIKVPIYVPGHEEDSLNLFTYLKAYLEATSDRRGLSSPDSAGIFISNTQVSTLVSPTFADTYVSAVPASEALYLVQVAPHDAGRGRYRYHGLQGTQF